MWNDEYFDNLKTRKRRFSVIFGLWLSFCLKTYKEIRKELLHDGGICLPTKSEWERYLKRIYEGETSIEEVANELEVPKDVVSQRYDKFLKELLEDREKKLDRIDKEVEEKERKIKSLSEGIERTDKKLKETEEKLPEMTKLEEMEDEWESKIQKIADTWRETKKRMKIFSIIVVILIALGVGAYFLIGGGTQSAEFRVENLEVNSKEAFVGETITLSLDVVNVGESVGTYVANLEFNGKTVEEKEVALNPNEGQKISITKTVEENGPIQVRIGELTDNFVAFNAFPFEGAYVKYETEGNVEPFGPASGTEQYEVTEVTEESYTWDFTPTDGIASLESFNIIKEAREYTTSLETPLTITDDKIWEENFVFIENVTKNTEFGTMKLNLYISVQTGDRPKIHSVYLEEKTKIPLRYELAFKNPAGKLVGKLLETNLNYLKSN